MNCLLLALNYAMWRKKFGIVLKRPSEVIFFVHEEFRGDGVVNDIQDDRSIVRRKTPFIQMIMSCHTLNCGSAFYLKSLCS